MSFKAIFDEKIEITGQPKDFVYFDTGAPAKLSLTATGPIDYYSWYFKTTDRTTSLLDDEFTNGEWTGSYDFYGLTGGKGLTDKYDGAELYCKVWDHNGQSVESKHIILKKYKNNVDRNVTIKMPEVGQTFDDYIAHLDENVKPAELILDKELFSIYECKDNGENILDGEKVFKAGRKYEFCLNMILPENVSTDAIWQFYSNGTIVNGEEHGEADSVDADERCFTDFWTTPVLGSNEKEYSFGDVDGNGRYNVNDATKVLREAALLANNNPRSFTDKQWIAADLDFNDRITVTDATLVMRYCAYLANNPKDNDIVAWLASIGKKPKK